VRPGLGAARAQPRGFQNVWKPHCGGTAAGRKRTPGDTVCETTVDESVTDMTSEGPYTAIDISGAAK